MIVDRLNAVVKAAGLNAPALAEVLGFKTSTVYTYLREKDPRDPPTEFLVAICQKFDISPRWLLLGEGAMNGEKDTTNIDRRLLEGSIAAVIEAGGGDLPADKVAKVVVIVYEAALSTGHIDKTSIPGLIELAR